MGTADFVPTHRDAEGNHLAYRTRCDDMKRGGRVYFFEAQNGSLRTFDQGEVDAGKIVPLND